MKTVALLALLALAPSLGLATTKTTPAPIPVPVPAPTADAEAQAAAAAQAAAQAAADAKAAAQAQANGDQTTEVSTELTFRDVRQTPPAFSGTTNTTAVCRFALGGGGSSPGGALSFILARKDPDCERLILAQYMRSIGNIAASEHLLCRIREMQATFGENCLAMVHEVRVIPTPRPAPTPVPAPAPKSREELIRETSK